jgi:hypothetical protein
LLDRPLYDIALTSRFTSKKLLHAKNDKQADKLMADFRLENGEGNYRGVILGLAWAASASERGDFDEQRKQEQEPAARLFAHFLPDGDPHHLSSLYAAPCYPQAQLIDSLASFDFDGMDAALLKIIPRVAPLELTSPEETFEQYSLVHACANRLAAHAAQNPALRASLAKELAAFRRTRREAPDSAGSKSLVAQLTKLQKQLAETSSP